MLWILDICFLAILAVSCDAFSACLQPRQPTTTILKAGSSLLEEEVSRVIAQSQGEKDTIARARVEEEILTSSSAPRDPLEEATRIERKVAMKNNKRFWKEQQRLIRHQSGGGGGGGGFGSAQKTNAVLTKTEEDDDESIKHIAFEPKLDVDGYAALIRETGVARKNNVISLDTTTTLRSFIDEELIRSNDQIASGEITPQSRFARVLLKGNRWDMSLPFEQTEHGGDIVMQALYELLGDSEHPEQGSVGHIFESALSCHAKLHEFGAMISDPQSDRQILHPDMAHQGDVQIRTGPPFLTCFVAVQDVDEAMGPTEFLPCTNTEASHEEFADYDRRDEMLKRVPTKLSLLKDGDCSMYDTTTLHAGSANRSEKRRRIFYFTFRSVSMMDDRTRDEPGSIRADLLERQLTLKDIRDALSKWRKE